MLDHADQLEQQLELHAPDQPMVMLGLTDDVYLRSYNWTRVALGIPLPPMDATTDVCAALFSAPAWPRSGRRSARPTALRADRLQPPLSVEVESEDDDHECQWLLGSQVFFNRQGPY
jgi:hypothetical protein